MNVKAVLGLSFGDEGKGLVTDYLCSKSENPLVVRFSGGHQAGHTVVYNGIRHVFSSFGSGTLRGVPTYWSKFCPMSPIALYNEYIVLKEKGITPKLYIDEHSPVVTPYDQICNQSTIHMMHGTCGVGVGTTIEREENHYHLLFEDLFRPAILKIKMQMIQEYYGQGMVDLTEFYNAVEFIVESDTIFKEDTENVFKQYGDLIFEGSQGLLLDKDIGFFPHVTRSNTGTKNVITLCEGKTDISYYLVTRAYQTRHGNGPMTNEKLVHNIKSNPLESNIENEMQGKFRRTLLDVDLLDYAVMKEFYNLSDSTLVVTCLDHIENEYRYTSNEKIYYCKDEYNFVKSIEEYLCCDGGTLVSHSDESKNMEIMHDGVSASHAV